MSLREQLQTALGAAYTIQRELGGGGMSRVFVARDETLGRDVVVKVLPPNLLAGVSADRFDREVRLAARLQHAHIVPVLSAGQMDDVPFYTMPFVDGASLRDRLSTGPLPVGEAVSILRDVARALAYAHERGIVHRDIKPDNVLVAGGSAVVTDFGIAKALSAARTGAPGETLTQAGISIGTPAYMAPEQAAADPATDHRADLYSFGCLAYELLTGRAPFTAKSPQKLLAAHLSERPESIQTLRPEVPPSLAELVAACLEKEPDARPQSATEILQRLEAVASGASDTLPALMVHGRGMLVRALVIYAIGFALVAILARIATSAIGLPDWVFPGALVVMALGFPVVLFTAYLHRVARRVGAPSHSSSISSSRRSSGAMQTMAVRAHPHWSWRRVAIGGGLALTGFVVLVVAYMALRALGIGPAGSLLAAGTIGEHEKLLVADLESSTRDTTLGPVVTDALRTALGQSSSVQVLQANAMQDVLLRMQRRRNTRVDAALAKEIAEREGISAIVDGRLIEVGGRYVVSLRIASRAGDDLATFRETADDEKGLLPAIDRVAKQVRAKIGESLRTVQRTPPLEQVTTPSLEALRKYVEGSRVLNEEQGLTRGTQLLEEAIALDSSFAMAYRRLAIEYGNRRLRDRADRYYEKAFEHRDRLTESERYQLLGSYYQNSRNADPTKAQEAYLRLLAIQPNNVVALNNLALLYGDTHQYEAGDSLLARAIRAEPQRPNLYSNRAIAQVRLGQLDAAAATLDTLQTRFPNQPRGIYFRAQLLWTRRKFDSVAVVLDQLDQRATEASDRTAAKTMRGTLARLRGRLRDARRFTYEGFAAAQGAGDRGAMIRAGLYDAGDVAILLGDRTRALHAIDTLLRHHRLDTLSGFVRREYLLLVTTYAVAGEAERAREAMEEWTRKQPTFRQPLDDETRQMMVAYVDLANGRYREAALGFRRADERGCSKCEAPLEGQAWERASAPDSAIKAYEKFVNTPVMLFEEAESYYLPMVHRRLGELYEARGDRDRALRNYRAFVELWKDADPELQPQVMSVKQRVAALSRSSDAR